MIRRIAKVINQVKAREDIETKHQCIFLIKIKQEIFRRFSRTFGFDTLLYLPHRVDIFHSIDCVVILHTRPRKIKLRQSSLLQMKRPWLYLNQARMGVYTE